MSEIRDRAIAALAEVLDDQITLAITRGTPTHFLADESDAIATGALSQLEGGGWALIETNPKPHDSGESSESIDLLSTAVDMLKGVER